MSESVPKSSAPRSHIERRERRLAVEQSMLDGLASGEITSTMATQFGVSDRTIRSDMRKVEAKWAKDDQSNAPAKRAAVLRRLDRLSRVAERAGDLATAVRAAGLLGRFLGMGVRAALVSAHEEPASIVEWVRSLETDDDA